MINVGRRKKLLLRIITLALVVCSLFNVVQTTFALAEEREVKFEQSNVLEDLRSSVGFNVLDYPFSSVEDKMEIISFVEYCYSYKINMLDNYGLYIYVYNPMGKNIDVNSEANTIQMATAYDSEGVPKNYEKFNLKFCSKSEESNYKNLFYKFKVIDKKVDGTYFHERVNSNQRRYDVSGIELIVNGESTAKEYGTGGTYRFTGYAKGYGPEINEESNLVCEINQLERVELNTNHTFYRTGEYKKNYRHDLTSVYFAVPNRLLEEYGKLQKIKAEWYEYQTTPICITSNDTVASMLSPYVGKTIYKDSDNPLQLYTGYQSMVGSNGHYDKYEWAYNCEYTTAIDEVCRKIAYLFVARNGVSKYVLQNDNLQKYVERYNKSFDDGYVYLPGKTLSQDLFEKDLSPEREKVSYVGEDIHHKLVEFDANNTFDMLSYDDMHSGWYKFFAGLFGLAPSEVDKSYKGISPIKVVTDEDMLQSNLSSSLLIDGSQEGLEKFRNFYNKSKEEDKTVVLFRFAQTDYINLPVIAYDRDKGKNLSGDYGRDTYIVQESIFMNFDVIQLTFNKDGKYMVIPVVNSPIDVYNDLTLPNNGSLGLKQLLIMVLGLALLAVILFTIVPLIVKGVGSLIKFPFREQEDDKYMHDHMEDREE